MVINELSQTLRKLLPLRPCGAVIVAAGTASRMGGIDKVMAPLLGEPMLAHTVRAFQNSQVIRQIVVVTRADLVQTVTELCKPFDKVKAVVVGGSTRTESVENGLNALSKGIKMAAVHDGARPLVSDPVIDRTVRAANTYGAAAPAIPVKDTVKQVEGGIVKQTPDRSKLRAVQTPQVFDVDILRGALKKVRSGKLEVTDDCSAVELLGMSVKIVEGDERNLKITTPIDLQIAKLLMEEKP